MKAELEALIEQMITRGILFDEAVKEFEKQFILKVVSQHKNNLSKAAEVLGIHRNTLSKRMLEYQGSDAHAKGKGNGKSKVTAPKRKQTAARQKVKAKAVARSA